MNILSRDAQLAALLAELTDRAQRGEAVDLEQICEAHPVLAGELRTLWGAVLVAEAAGSAAESLPTGAPADAAPLELPREIGDYELLSELGRGGMGVVYRARQNSLGREVAVKMILQGRFASSGERRRLRAEAEAAARLSHPHIVPVYEVGELGGYAFYSMKLVHGDTLAERLARGPLPPRQIAEWMVPVCRAIEYAHQRGVLHRDLKPSNILLDEEDRPHVSDFGLAKQLNDSVTSTRTGMVLGTPSYMAPEQATGGRVPLGPTSDVYSLGAILYHMLTGRPPFQARSALDVMLMLREQDVTPPRLVAPAVHRDLELIALRCLQKPRHLRYASAGALADDLEAFLRDEPLAARSGRFGEILARMFRETHHVTVLENWGLLWMWHSLVLLIVSSLTEALEWLGYRERWYYIALWTPGLGTWAAVFWWLRRRMGPVTFVERQIAHVWAASLAAIGLLFYLEVEMQLPVLTLSPVLGLIAGMVFLIKAGILTGTFYLQAAALFATTFVMARFPQFGHLVFGLVSAACFFFPGLKYYRQRNGAAG